MSNVKNKAATNKYQNGGQKQLDLYSYTGKVKFFDKDKGFGYIQEIPDTKNLNNVVKEWRVTSEQLGNTVIHRGEFVYFMKHGKTIGEITPLNFRDLLKAPCPECGRRDYIPGKNSVCNHCGHKFGFATDSAKGDSRDNDPAFNCLAGTNKNKACPVCGRHAWKRYGYHQDIRCRCCGSDYPPSIFEIWIINVATFLTFVLLITFLFYIFIKEGWVF